LQIYRFTLTMTMSIVHRITGIANYAGTAILALWLLSAAVDGAFFELMNLILSSWFGQLVLFGYTWSLFHHALGGIRHFVWDFLKAMDPVGRELIVRLQLGGSILLTLGAWALWVWR
jgi:succinate dehydrogenase / fumarate reductase cytochrome b subunit